MNPNHPSICTFFLKGNCKYGDKCKNLHQIGENNANKSIYKNNTYHNFNKNQNNTIYTEKNNQNHNQNNQIHNQNQNYNHTNNFIGKQGFKNNNNFMNNKFNTGIQSKKEPKICSFFLKPGGCKNGDKCDFLHAFHSTLNYLLAINVNMKIVGFFAICKFWNIFF